MGSGADRLKKKKKKKTACAAKEFRCRTLLSDDSMAKKRITDKQVGLGHWKEAQKRSLGNVRKTHRKGIGKHGKRIENRIGNA